MNHEGRYHVIEIQPGRPRGLWATETDPLAARRAAGLVAWLTGSRVEVWDMVRDRGARLWAYRRAYAERRGAGGLPVGPAAYENLPDVPAGWWCIPLGQPSEVPARALSDLLDDPGWLESQDPPGWPEHGLNAYQGRFDGLDVPF